jgi:haloalkane dehalogenase
MPDKQDLYHSKRLIIYESSIHYLESGTGKPILFLHGNPTSSYLWRNIIPEVSNHGRCIAPDLIGMGDSDKPSLDYTFQDHYKYMEGFIEKLGLQDIILVLHDWGSAIGFHFYRNHPEKVRGLVFMEAFVKPWEMKNLSWWQRLGFLFLRWPLTGELFIYGANGFLNLVLPVLTMRKLTRFEKKHYKRPFKKRSSRKPMLRWPREIPINGKPEHTYHIFLQYLHQLVNSEVPKLLFYAEPGAIIDRKTRQLIEKQYKNLKQVYLGKGYHFLPEDYPGKISSEIIRWLQTWIKLL